MRTVCVLATTRTRACFTGRTTAGRFVAAGPAKRSFARNCVSQIGVWERGESPLYCPAPKTLVTEPAYGVRRLAAPFGGESPLFDCHMKSALSATCVLALAMGMAGLAKDAAPPAAERPWAPTRLGEYERELARRAAHEKGGGTHTPVDPRHVHTLPELIDLAQRNNPETRVAWERARQAAAGVGLSESLYFPYLMASAGAWRARWVLP